jgi:uncharacterized integral membrane protein
VTRLAAGSAGRDTQGVTTPDAHRGQQSGGPDPSGAGVRSDVPGVRMSSGGDPSGPATPSSAGAPGPATPPPSSPPPSSSPPPRPPAQEQPKGAKKGGRGKGLGLSVAAALLIFVTVVLVLFVVFNTQSVEISLVFGNVTAPLVLALVIAAVLGGLVVAMAGLAMRARHKQR